MSYYTVNLDFDPKNKYDKARKDIFQAIKSVNELDPDQQQQLICELVGIKQFNLFVEICQQIANKQKPF